VLQLDESAGFSISKEHYELTVLRKKNPTLAADSSHLLMNFSAFYTICKKKELNISGQCLQNFSVKVFDLRIH
jgi:hypothetical protein